MSIKFSEDVIPLKDIKINPGKIVRHTSKTHRPVLLTNRGRGGAVMQSLEDYEQSEDEKMFMRAVVEDLGDLENGRQSNMSEVKKRLKLKK